MTRCATATSTAPELHSAVHFGSPSVAWLYRHLASSLHCSLSPQACSAVCRAVKAQTAALGFLDMPPSWQEDLAARRDTALMYGRWDPECKVLPLQHRLQRSHTLPLQFSWPPKSVPAISTLSFVKLRAAPQWLRQ